MTLLDNDIRERAFDLGKKEGRLERAHERRHRPAFTAASKRIDLTSADQVRRVRRKLTESETRAWLYYDRMPEVKFGASFKGRSMRKIRIFPAFRATPDSDPIPIDTRDPETGEFIVPEDVQAICRTNLDRVTVPTDGGGLLLERWGQHGFVIGESWLCGYADDDSATGETWRQCSSREIAVTSRDRFAIVPFEGAGEGDWTILDPETSVVVRIWNPHAEWHGRPDSSVLGVLDILDQLWFLQAASMGQAMNRLNAGIAMFPESVFEEPIDGDNVDSQGEARRGVTVNDLIEHWSAGIRDPLAPSVAVPFIIEMDEDLIEKVRFEYPSRPFDAIADARMDKLVIRAARGFDLPAEVFTGVGDVTHWNAWYIGDETYRAYIEPDVREWANSFHHGYYRKAIEVGGVTDPWLSMICVGYDESDLVADPDQTDQVFKAAEMGVIGKKSARRRLSYSEADAPVDVDDDASIRRTDRSQQPLGESPPSDVTTGEPATGAPDGQPPAPAITAAGRRTPVEFGTRWAQRDRQLRERIMALCDAAMTRALDRAGAKLRTKAVRASAAHADVVKPVPNHYVAAQLGPALVQSLGLTAEDLFEGVFDEVGRRFESLTRRAQIATLRDLSTFGLTEDEQTEMGDENERNRHAAALVLVAGMTALATDRLYNPAPATATEETISGTGHGVAAVGELDVSSAVPPSLVREAMSVAGGAPSAPPGGTPRSQGASPNSTTQGGTGQTRAVDGRIGGQVATGETVIDFARRAGLELVGYVWDYGDPAARDRNFEPHLDLDGQTFTSQDDPALANFDSFPEVDFYWPGDHDGCQCDIGPIFTPADQED